MRIDTNVSALNALGVRQAVRANNIANMNTDGFKESNAVLETGSNGQGVRVGAIEQSSAPGALRNDFSTVTGADGLTTQVNGPVETSNTDIVSNLLGLNMDKLAFSANVKAIQTQDDMTGSLLNLKT